MMNGRLIALNRFISRSAEKCRPFFQKLKRNMVDFHWNEECEAAFQGLKWYLTSPPQNPLREKYYISTNYLGVGSKWSFGSRG